MRLAAGAAPGVPAGASTATLRTAVAKGGGAGGSGGAPALPPRGGGGEVGIPGGEMLWIEDAPNAPRVASEGVVAGPPYLKSYIGAPIRLADRTTPGVLAGASTEK